MEKERERQRKTEGGRQTGRQTHRETERETGRDGEAERAVESSCIVRVKGSVGATGVSVHDDDEDDDLCGLTVVSEGLLLLGLELIGQGGDDLGGDSDPSLGD